MDDRTRCWVEETTGGRVTRVERPSTGGSRELYCVDVALADGGVLPLVLRMETGSAFAGTPISLHREAVVYAALADSAVPVPRLIALSPDRSALLLERVAGESRFFSLGAPLQRQTLADFVDALAALHNLDVSALPLDGFERPASAEDHARLDLGLWARLARESPADQDPLVRYAGAWLHAHAPDSVERCVLVQGDTGPGNFIAEGGRVTGIVDWEFAHLGDPMDDIAWLEMRCDIGPEGAFGDLSVHLARYCAATGLEIDRARVDYYRVAVFYRCAVTAALAMGRGGGARGWFPYALARQRFHRSLAEALTRVTGISEDAGETIDPDEIPATPRTPWYDRTLEDLRAGVRGIGDPELREQTRNLQIALHYLRGWDRLGTRSEKLDKEDRIDSLGIGSSDTAGFESAVEKGGAGGDATVFRYLLRRMRREQALWRSLLDRPRRRQ